MKSIVKQMGLHHLTWPAVAVIVAFLCFAAYCLHEARSLVQPQIAAPPPMQVSTAMPPEPPAPPDPPEPGCRMEIDNEGYIHHAILITPSEERVSVRFYNWAGR